MWYWFDQFSWSFKYFLIVDLRHFWKFLKIKCIRYYFIFLSILLPFKNNMILVLRRKERQKTAFFLINFSVVRNSSLSLLSSLPVCPPPHIPCFGRSPEVRGSVHLLTTPTSDFSKTVLPTYRCNKTYPSKAFPTCAHSILCVSGTL